MCGAILIWNGRCSYGLLEAIQIVIDLSCHIVSARNLGVPATYAECVELLSRAGLLSGDVAKTVAGMVGLQNILVHEYISVELKRVYDLLDRLDVPLPLTFNPTCKGTMFYPNAVPARSMG